MHLTRTENKAASRSLQEWTEQVMRTDAEDGIRSDISRGRTGKNTALRHWSGGQREETRSTKNNMKENGWRRMASSWVAVVDCNWGLGKSFSSKQKWMERQCQSPMCLMARRDRDRDWDIPHTVFASYQNKIIFLYPGFYITFLCRYTWHCNRSLDLLPSRRLSS